MTSTSFQDIRNVLLNTYPNLPFGKYRGRSISEVDSGYLSWMLTKSKSPDCFAVLADFVDNFEEEIRQELLSRSREKVQMAMADTHLTDHQQDAADATVENLLGYGMARLQGGAGYGKSYACSDIAAQLIRQGHRVRAAATSYVATQVLAQQFDPMGIEAATIARTLRLEKVFEGPEEKYLLNPESYAAAEEIFKNGGVLIVDEDSMVSDDIANFLINQATEHRGLLLSVGDAKQLPPVKQEHPSRFVLDETIPRAELTIPMRYSEDSSLYAMEKAAARAPFEIQPIADENISVFDTNDAMLDFAARQIKADPDATHRALLFRRNDVTEANARIRHYLYGENPRLVEEDEELLVLATTDIQNGNPDREDGCTRYYSGSRFRVTDIEERTDTVIPHYRVRFQGSHLWVPIMFAITETRMDTTKLGGAEYTHALKDEFERVIDAQDGKRDWSIYRKLKNAFLPVGYSYATTIHRAQGQTVDYAYINPWTLSGMSSQLLRNALAYVAMTRARKHLSITQNPYARRN